MRMARRFVRFQRKAENIIATVAITYQVICKLNYSRESYHIISLIIILLRKNSRSEKNPSSLHPIIIDRLKLIMYLYMEYGIILQYLKYFYFSPLNSMLYGN